MLRCVGCGSTETIEQIRANHPEAISCCPERNMVEDKWQLVETAPKQSDLFILLWCPEDKSRWLASWQGGEWCGVDDNGLTRSGHSLGDPDYVTGWFISHWMPLPVGPAPRALGQ